MCLRFLKHLKNLLRMSPTPSGGQTLQTEIDRIKADADATLTKFSGETTQFCLDRIRRQVKA